MIPYTNYNINIPEWMILFFQFIQTHIFPIFLIAYEYSKTSGLLSKDWFWNSPTITINISEEEQFLENKKHRFLTYMNNESIEKSVNIDPLFYQKSEFIEYMKSQNTVLETTWKSRILMVTTPRGNITMYYDPYKLGFAYYSDQNMFSYDILNSVAMNYVITYRCLEFFIDEYILPADSKNPLKIHYKDETKCINGQQQLAQLPKSPFMKPKQKNTQQQQPEKLRNKFIYLGNMRNFSPCLKPIKKSIIQGFTSELLDGIDSGMNWSDYKKQRLNKE